MSKSTSNSVFNYSQLESAVSEFVREQTTEIQSLLKRTAQDIIEIGSRLIEVKEKLEHGQFKQWLETEFAWDERSARRFMSVPRTFKADKLSALDIAPSALYILAAPSTPQLVRDEALSLAQQGNVITHKIAQELKNKHKYKESAASENFSKSNKNKDLKKKPSLLTSDKSTNIVQDAPSFSSHNQEIIKISPQQETSSIVPQNKPVELYLSLHKDQQVDKPESFWQLGAEHFLYYGHPNAPQFKERLPQNIALNLSFPPNPNWDLDTLVTAKTSLSLHSIYQNVDPHIWRSLFQNILELYTESQEIVVFSFLPDPELIFLSERLGCRCFIAEPRLEQCQALLTLWQQKKGILPNQLILQER